MATPQTSDNTNTNTNANKPIPDSNTDKEMKQQSESDSEPDRKEHLLDLDEFNAKYNKLQQKWTEGHTKQSDIDEELVKKAGKDAYILSYVLPESEKLESKITYHPNYSYSYTNYEKENVLPNMDISQLNETKERFQSHINRLEKNILHKIKISENKRKAKDSSEQKEEELKLQRRGWIVPEYSIPIRTDIRKFDFKKLAQKQRELSGRLFDVIMTDPPWQLASANPTRGVAIGYSQLEDNIISGLPFDILQENGFLFIWVINAKYRLALQLFKKWGYKMIGDIAWVKQTVNRRIANGHGFYLQHAKETCLIGLKGDIKKIKYHKSICSNVIYSERRGQSQKPEEIYQYIEQLVPKGYYLEVFARRNNLRNGWFSIGNEL